MRDLHFETLFKPPKEVTDPINRGLHEYNLAHLGEEVIYNYHRFAVTARDENGQVIGGIIAEMVWEWLYINTLWVNEAHRGQGIGSQLLRMAEEAALEKGFTRSHLETTDFQALNFYLKNGYEIFGKLEDKPAGSNWYYIKKILAR